MIADCGLRIADCAMGGLRDMGLCARRTFRVLLSWSRRKEVGRGWKCWQQGRMSLPGFVRGRRTVLVQSSSAASWGNGRRSTRVVLERLNGNLGSLFGHAVLTASEPEYVFRFMESVIYKTLEVVK
jgi:hypothetical protein